MRSTWWLIAVPVSVSLGVACHSSSPHTEQLLDPRIGTYEFSERIPSARPNETMTFEGRFTILVDTVLIDAAPGPCRYDRQASGSISIHYQCGDVRVAFDRMDPVGKARYSVTVRVADQSSTSSGSGTSGRGSGGGGRTGGGGGRGTGAAAGGASTYTPDKTEVKTGRLNAKRVR